MEPDVGERAGGAPQRERVLARRIRGDERDVPPRERVGGLLGEPALVANLERVAQGPIASVRRGQRRAARRPRVVPPGPALGAPHVVRQGREERVGPGPVEAQLRRQLPEDRAERLPEAEDAGGEEVRERRAKAPQLEHVRDVAAALDREEESVGNGRAPGVAGRRPRQRVERAVDLYGRQARGEVGEPALLGQALRIEAAAPVGIDPARGPDANPRRHGQRESKCGAARGSRSAA